MLKIFSFKDNYMLLLILISITIISVYFNPDFNILRGGDTGQYIIQSENIFSEVSKLRPPVFSLLISISKVLLNENWITFIIFIICTFNTFLSSICFCRISSYNHRYFIFCRNILRLL